MSLLRKSALIPLLGATAACATAAPPKIADTSCTAFRPISYAQLPPGQTDDPGNKADSDQTVLEIDQHNASWDRLCPNGSPSEGVTK